MSSRSGEREERKYWKLVFRRLPEKNYSEEDFKEDLRALCEKTSVLFPSVHINHFIEGKASKRRGPISSTAFITTSEASVAKFTKYLSSPDAFFIPPSRLAPSIDLDNPKPAVQAFYKQPEVTLALYPKGFKLKVRLL